MDTDTIIDNVRSILDGIDREETENGWWETSIGAKFGKERLSDLEFYLRSELGKQQWQPIETAPRDGTEIILGAWDEEGKFITVANARWVENYEATKEFWHDIEGSFKQEDVTHWMPLPQPPITDAEEKQNE